jgi:hypothetical protein
MPRPPFPHEVTSLIYELGESIPIPLREKFFKLVTASLSGDEGLFPYRIAEACAAAQRTLLHAPSPSIDEPATARPTRRQA